MKDKRDQRTWLMRARNFMGAYRPSQMESAIKLISLSSGL
jgi:hypothetical protein